MASRNYDESDHMLNAPPTPGTGDVEDWEDGGFEELVEQELAKEFFGSEGEPGLITTDENGDLEAELAAEMFSSDNDEDPDPVGVAKSNALEDRNPQEVTAKERAKFRPDTQKVANNFFKAPARKSQAHIRTGSNASAMASISSLSTTSNFAKVPTKGRFAKPVPKFNSMTIIQGDGKVTPGSKLASLAGTEAADREAARLAKIADIKAQKKSVEERRASMGVQATAKGEFDNKAAQTIGEVMHPVMKKPEHYHPDGEKLAMAMETRNPSIVPTKANLEHKGIAVPVSRKKQVDPLEAKAAHDLKKSKMRSEAVLKGKKKKKDAELEREESKRVAKLAMAKNLAAMPEHLQQGEMERQVKARQLSDHYLAQAAAKKKRKRPDTESSAPLKKTKNSKMPAQKDLSSPHLDEREDEDEGSDEMEGVTVERKILAHKKTQQLDNIKSGLKPGSNSFEQKNSTSAASQKRDIFEHPAPPSKKRRAQEPDTLQSTGIVNKKRKVESASTKVAHTLYQHTEAWKMVRDGYKERKEAVPPFVPHVEGQPSLYASHVEKKGVFIPAQPPKAKAKPRTKATLSPSPKFSLARILAEQEDDAARKLAKEEERMNVRARLHAPDRYQGMADQMRGSAQAQEVAANVERLRQEKLQREQGFRDSKYSAKNRKADVKEARMLEKRWRNVNSTDSESKQSKQTRPLHEPRTRNKANELKKSRMPGGEMTGEDRKEMERKWRIGKVFKGLEKTGDMKLEIDKRTWQEKKRDDDARKEKAKTMTRKEKKELGSGWKEERTWEKEEGKRIMWRVLGYVEGQEDGDEKKEEE